MYLYLSLFLVDLVGELKFEGLLHLMDLEGKIHRDCLLLRRSDVFFFKIHRNQLIYRCSDVSEILTFCHIHRNRLN